jgi:hypothetical protein
VRHRLREFGIHPGYLPGEESAAYFDVSLNNFEDWIKKDPTAPKPYWIGGFKRWKISELTADPACQLRAAISFQATNRPMRDIKISAIVRRTGLSVSHWQKGRKDVAHV